MPSLALLLSSLAAAACDAPTDASALQAYLTAADQAYEQLDIPRFKSNAETAANAAPCLDEPLTPDLAGSMHRVAGMLAFVERDPDLAEQRFAAARVATPDYAFPTTMVPDGHPLRTHYAAIDLSKVPVLPVVPTNDGAILLDGRPSLKRRDGLPVYFQRLDRDAVVTTTRLLSGSAPLPDYPKAPPRGAAGTKRIAGPALMIGGLGATALGIGLALAARSGVCERAVGSCDPATGKIQDDARAANRSIRTGMAVTGVGVAAIGAGVVITLGSGSSDE
jgi:hypothetical protein